MKKQRRAFVGRVISGKMEKTAVVEVERLTRHRVYGKTMRSVKRYMVHNEGNEGKEGDLVKIEETRPLSKEKRWTIVEILERAR